MHVTVFHFTLFSDMSVEVFVRVHWLNFDVFVIFLLKSKCTKDLPVCR